MDGSAQDLVSEKQVHRACYIVPTTCQPEWYFQNYTEVFLNHSVNNNMSVCENTRINQVNTNYTSLYFNEYL